MALQEFKARHMADSDGNPAGGTSEATGILVEWQNGPLGKVGSLDRKEPSGAFVETVIAIAKDRIEYYQKAAGGKFSCAENADAIMYLQNALNILGSRTRKREMAGVEGTHGRRPGEGVVFSDPGVHGSGLAGASQMGEPGEPQMCGQDGPVVQAEGAAEASSGSDN